MAESNTPHAKLVRRMEKLEVEMRSLIDTVVKLAHANATLLLERDKALGVKPGDEESDHS